MNFADLGLSDPLLASVETAGYSEPTPIQAQAIPAVLMMKDIIGIAQTGTGKTASFVLPMIDILSHGRRRARMPRSLILEPTRELAAQVAENFEKYGKNHDLSMALLIGGVQMGDQVRALDEGVDVLIATPGRLMDLFERGKILLTGCDLLVIDEADRMLDMGFIPDIEFICSKLPTPRQTMLFSATMPPPIEKLADKFLSSPKRIEVARRGSSSENIAQHKVFVTTRKKRDTLRDLLRTDDVQTAIVFANRKTTVRDLAKSLNKDGFRAGEIHGDIDQGTRNAELQRFKDGVINILVASDVAARGLDIKGVSHVFNYDTPWHPDDYVHRVGRTGRAGAKGRAFTFVTPEDAEAIGNVEKLTKMAIPVYAMDGTGTDDTAEAGTAAPAPADTDEADAPAKPASRNRRARGRKDAEAPRGDRRALPAPALAPTETAEAPSPAPTRSRRRARDEGRQDEPRRDETVRVEPKPNQPHKAAQRQEAPGQDASRQDETSQDAPRRSEPRPSAPRRSEPAEPGEWNGPVPGFLGTSAL